MNEQMLSNNTTQIIDLLKQRDAQGMRKYGVSLDRTDLSPEEWMQHAIEEALDFACYLQGLKRTVAAQPAPVEESGDVPMPSINGGKNPAEFYSLEQLLEMQNNSAVPFSRRQLAEQCFDFMVAYSELRGTLSRKTARQVAEQWIKNPGTLDDLAKALTEKGGNWESEPLTQAPDIAAEPPAQAVGATEGTCKQSLQVGELLPCPFCGSSMIGHIEESTVKSETLGVVMCGCCGCKGPSLYDTIEEFTQRWNERRQSERELAELKQAMENGGKVTDAGLSRIELWLRNGCSPPTDLAFTSGAERSLADWILVTITREANAQNEALSKILTEKNETMRKAYTEQARLDAENASLHQQLAELQAESEKLRPLQYAVGTCNSNELPDAVVRAWQDSPGYRADEMQRLREAKEKAEAAKKCLERENASLRQQVEELKILVERCYPNGHSGLCSRHGGKEHPASCEQCWPNWQGIAGDHADVNATIRQQVESLKAELAIQKDNGDSLAKQLAIANQHLVSVKSQAGELAVSAKGIISENTRLKADLAKYEAKDGGYFPPNSLCMNNTPNG